MSAATSAWRWLLRRLLSTKGSPALLALAAVLGTLAVPAAASAQAEDAHWRLESRSVPTYFKPGAKEAQIRVVALNLSSISATPPITITDSLPKGLVATSVRMYETDTDSLIESACQPLPEISCTWTKTRAVNGKAARETIPPYGALELLITVDVEPGAATGAINEATVRGANTKPVSTSQAITVSGAPVPFGVERYEVKPEDEGGSVASGAGGHPFQLTTTLSFNEVLQAPVTPGQPQEPAAPALVKDLTFDLPPGLLADATAVPQCPSDRFTEEHEAGQGHLNGCAANTAVGVASVSLYVGKGLGYQTLEVPLFNLVPGAGEPARFGFEASGVPVFLDTAIRTGENYGAVVSVKNASTLGELISSTVTFWGAPGESSHDSARGWECIDAGYFEEEQEGKFVKRCPTPEEVASQQAEEGPMKALLTLPTACSSQAPARETTVSGDAWPTTPGHDGIGGEEHKLEGEADRYLMPAPTDCESLEFNPKLEVQPETTAASTPTGMNVLIKTPQKGLLEPSGRSEADIRDTTTVLPEGLLLNPSAANGLEACGEGETGGSGGVGFTGFQDFAEVQTATFTSKLPEPLNPGENFCPNGSEVGTVEIHTPLLSDPLTGGLYLAQQNANPFGSLIALYIVAEDRTAGVLVKLAGNVSLNEGNGQVTSTFESTPQTPFEELKIHFFQGARASQTSPAQCGSHTSSAAFTPWAQEGAPPSTSTTSFQITSGPNGSPCPNGSLPFAPGFQAGSVQSQAGALTPFRLTIARPDGQQALRSINIKLPPGVAALIKEVTPCPTEKAEASARTGTDQCETSSQVGTTTSLSGLGGDPFKLPGTLYLTGALNQTSAHAASPFGLLAVTPAVAGPFNLGDVSILSTLEVDRNTAAVTVQSEPIPQFIKGVPAQVKELSVTVERPEGRPFEFNPTNCSPMAITGALAGYEGANVPESNPFQVSNCALLKFHPIFTASTQGGTSKTEGASLDVKIAYPPGTYANVAKSVTDLPYALPSRLTTIQKACRDTIFEVNPASCDEGSMIGEGIVKTPVFKNVLRGPAYLVSHGNRAFPDIEIVLQGEGLTLVLDGQTDIKKGITKTTFNSVPDAPVETFQLVLPEGPHSALAANENLCDPTKTVTAKVKVTKKVRGHTLHVTKSVTKTLADHLTIPTTLTGQNGLVLEQQTPIVVSGCKAVKSFKANKKPKKKGKKKRKK